MKRTEVDTLYALHKKDELKEEVFTVAGFVKTCRSSKSIAFVEICDGSTIKTLQIVVSEKVDNFNEISAVAVGVSVVVVGKIVLTPGSGQPFELSVQKFIVEGDCQSDYPLQKKRHGAEFLRTIPHLRLRTNLGTAVFRIRSGLSFALHSFFNERGFVYIHTPIITGSDCEGAGAMFQVTTLPLQDLQMTKDGKVDYSKDFFGGAASLTVSGQLEAEAAAGAFGKVYTFGPTFRAENSNTSRHAAEFWMIEPEIAFADLADDMQLAEDMLKYVIRYILSNYEPELTFLNEFVDKGLKERLIHLCDSDYLRISYTDAISKLCEYEGEFEYKAVWGCDLQTEHERFLTEKIFAGPVFVTDYPKDIKSFYMRQNDDGKTVAAADLLLPGIGELIGGSQREERYDVLLSRMKELSLPTEEYKWYLDLRRFGTTKHAGFGLGFERLVMVATGVQNIRDVCFFPRTTGHF